MWSNSYTLLILVKIGTSTFENYLSLSTKLNTCVSYDLATPVLNIYLRELRTYIHQKTSKESSWQHYSEQLQTGNHPNVHQLLDT